MSRLSRTKETVPTVRAATPTLSPGTHAIHIKQWRGSKASLQTLHAYRQDIDRFLAFMDHQPLHWVELVDRYSYQVQVLAGTKRSSQARRLSAIKSLLTFGCKLFPQFFPVNVGAAFQPKQSKDTLAERVLPEEARLGLLNVQRRATEDRYCERNTVVLRLLYDAALRREELCRLSWRDVQPREDGQGHITVYSKGDKTWVILLEASLYEALLILRDTLGHSHLATTSHYSHAQPNASSGQYLKG